VAELTEVQKIRLLISDVGGDSGNDFVFDDDEINAFLEMGGDLFSAAAHAARTLAMNAVLVSRRIKFLELQTDGPAEAKALMDLAEKLDAKADSDSGFEIAELGLARNRSRLL